MTIHYLVMLDSDALRNNYFVNYIQNLELKPDAEFQRKNDTCHCADMVKPFIWKVEFFEIGVREDIAKQFEKILSEWMSFPNRNNFFYRQVIESLWKKSGMNTEFQKLSFDFVKPDLTSLVTQNLGHRNQILAKVIEKDIFRPLPKVCEKCCKLFLHEWL